MKSLIILMVLVLSLPLAVFGAYEDMEPYCSAPPYVTRTIPPNVMILMDNSEDMQNPAYTGDYTPNATGDNYIGYFKPTGCYSYSGNKFTEQLNTVPDPDRTYLAGETCPSSAPFRGNLLNWATMSRYDILQKVLIGGNTASKQGNSHTLVSISGAWADKTYDDCVFRVSNGNLLLTETYEGACSLLDATPTPIAFSPTGVSPHSLSPLKTFWFMFVRGLDVVYSSVSSKAETVATLSAKIWKEMDFVAEAWAAAPKNLDITVLSGSLNTAVGQPYSITLEGGGDNNTTYVWTTDPSPPASWLSGPTYQTSSNGKMINYRATWTGTPATAGTYTFTVTLSDTLGNNPATQTYTIVVAAEDLKINTTSFQSGTAGIPYYFELNGQGGVKPYTWATSSLPAGLSLGSSTVDGDTVWHVSGTPTAAGTTLVDLTLSDSLGTSIQRTNMAFVVDDSTLEIVSGSGTGPDYDLPTAYYNEPFSYSLVGSGGTSPYSWTKTSGSLPPGLSLGASGIIQGTPTSNCGSGCGYIYYFGVQLTDDEGVSVTRNFRMVSWGERTFLSIIDGWPSNILPSAIAREGYTYTFTGDGGTEPYVWSAGSTLPDGMTLSADGTLSWTPTRDQVNDPSTPYSITVRLTDDAGTTVAKTFTISVVDSRTLRSKTYNVKVELIEEPLTDGNGNGIWDTGETYTDSNGNGAWDGKQGVFQKFWDAIDPRARWGMTLFANQGGTTKANVSACIPASPASSFYTDVQNATASSASPLAGGLYGALNYYGFNSTNFAAYDSAAYSGCTSSDPMDHVPCRKNFLLVITSGSDVSGSSFTSASCTSTDPLVKNACVGYTTDFRDDLDKKQNVHTYIVNTMGTANNSVLEAAAAAGGGQYYSATDYSDLESNLIQAFEDILAQAASGTAVSVLTTSSRGIGSMIQAYFLPMLQDGDREVRWTGYTQNIWIDNQDNLREDTVADHKLHLDQDKVLRLFFDSETNETKAALFTTDDEGNIENCTSPTIKPFSDVSYNWEGGTELAKQNPGDRTLFTSKKEMRVTDASGTVVTRTISNNSFTEGNVTGTALLANALDADATYSAANIVRYTRGECLETGVSGGYTGCAANATGNFRDRRITIEGNKKVWKLGDIISSTPKVLSNSPQNTYHLDYGDNTYHQYITSDDYRNRVSLALVGANDGVLHAFRVGYLKDKDLTGGFKGEFVNDSSSTTNTELGKEVWGYIPLNAFPYLKYLAEPNYCHLYFNDLSVRLVDASVGGASADARVVGSWKTILLGGMRFGGGCPGGTPAPPLADTGYSVYYALDVTDPLNPVPLWEFSDVDMGFATTFPSVVRTGDKTTNGNWYVVVGSGSTRLPKNSVDIERNSTGYVYILDLKTGALVKKIALDHNAIVGDILAVDRDKDYHSETIYFGTSYYDSVNDLWKGKLAKIDIPDQSLAAAWTPAVTYMLTGDYPITASPDAAKDDTGTVWVYGGTGKYFSDEDEYDIAEHLLFGIKDTSGITYPVSATAAVADGGLTDQTNVTTEGTVDETTTACMHNPTSNQFENRTMVTSISPTSGAVAVPPVGWKMSLLPGERVITRPLAVGGLVDFLTYMPSSDECSYGGDSYLYALDYVTGVAPSNIAIRTPDTTVSTTTGEVSTSGAVTVSKGVLLGPGAPPTGEAIIVPPPKEGQEQLKKKIQVATGVIVEAENTPVISVVSKIVHWLKK